MDTGLVDFKPFTQSVVEIPDNVEIPMMVKVAQQFLNKKTGGEFFIPDPQSGRKFQFVPTIQTGDMIDELWEFSELIFHKSAPQEIRNSANLLPWVLTALCFDVLDDNPRIATECYNSENCGCTCEENQLTIILEKRIDFFSYHIIVIDLHTGGFTISTSGCWRGTQQDSQSIHYPVENCYRLDIRVDETGAVLWETSGLKPRKSLKLWGIDFNQLTKAANKLYLPAEAVK